MTEPQQFEVFVKSYQNMVFSGAVRMLGNETEAEDIAQEIFAKLFVRRKCFQQGSKFSTYLWRIALNHCYSDLRRSARRGEATLSFSQSDRDAAEERFADCQPTPDESLAASEVAEAVRRALAELPEQHRAVVVLRHYENLKFREIAEVLDLPEGTVKTRMTEALNALGRRLRAPLDLPLARMFDGVVK